MKSNMTETITVRELATNEVNQLLAEKKFGKLKPVTCNRCEEKTCFTRRIFEITGVVKNKQADEQTQQFIQFHFKQRYSIDFIFFKTHEGRFFVDSAVCGGCKSTAIAYDIELFDQDLISEASKLTGKSEAQVKKDLKKTYEMLKNDLA